MSTEALPGIMVFRVCEKAIRNGVSIVLNVTLLSPILQDVPFYILLEMEYRVHVHAKYDNNEVCHILVLSVTCRKKSFTQICITYLNLEKTHIYYVVCLMLFVDDVECLKTPPVCDTNANCKNTLGSYLCSCKEGFKGDDKTCQGKI